MARRFHHGAVIFPFCAQRYRCVQDNGNAGHAVTSGNRPFDNLSGALTIPEAFTPKGSRQDEATGFFRGRSDEGAGERGQPSETVEGSEYFELRGQYDYVACVFIGDSRWAVVANK